MALKLNVGAGNYPLPPSEGWVNIDECEDTLAEVILRIPPIPYDDGAVDEIYGGHYFEHLEPADAGRFLAEAWRVLRPGGKLGLMVPDMREVMSRYVHDEPAPMEFPQGVVRDLRDLDHCCAAIIFSTDQESHHQWAYDKFTLSRALMRAGFIVDGEFDRYHDPRLSTGRWYQVGVDCHKPEVAA